MSSYVQAAKIVTKETLMCGLKGAIEIVPGGSLITRAADVVERVQQRYELLGLGDRVSEVESRLTSFDQRMREIASEEIQGVIRGLHVPNLKGDALDEHIRNFRAIHRHGYAPAMFEGLLRDGPHWEDLRRMPENYGDVLDSDETLDPRKIPILIEADPLRLLELAPYAFAQLLSGRPAGSSHAPRLAGVEDIWAFRGHGAGESGKESALDLGGGVTLPMRLIPAGTFMMGGNHSVEEIIQRYAEGLNLGYAEGLNLDGDARDWFSRELPRHQVTISKPFYLGVYPVMVEQFRRFATQTGYRTDAEKGGQSFEDAKKGGYGIDKNGTWVWNESLTWRSPGFTQGLDHPVVLVSWNDAQAYCQWLSKAVECEARLPTEAEWEYAARAGSETAFPWGDDMDTTGRRCNLADRSFVKTYSKLAGAEMDDGYMYTSPVGTYEANRFGLHDMIGNVWEWCRDWLTPYEAKPAVNPTGAAKGEFRVLRGGSWCNPPIDSRASFRNWDRPASRIGLSGFRVLVASGIS